MTDPRHLLTRRQSLGVGLAGLTGAAFLVGTARNPGTDSAPAAPAATAAAQTPSCVLVPEVTEGPFFVDSRLDRTDIRRNSSGGSARAGVPLRLTVNVVAVDSAGTCNPYEGAGVDIWHADAEGEYSGGDTDFLRGYQTTDGNGAAKFLTIFPGWYRGRAVHIHVKVRTFEGSAQTFEYTSQLFFSETTIAQVFDVAPYAANGEADTSNASDSIYGETGGTSLVSMSGNASSGYSGTVTLGISGLPEEEDDADRARARVLAVGWTRDGRGRRVLRARLDLDEPMRSVSARIVREDRVVATRKVRGLRKGRRTVTVPVPNGVDPGVAGLRLVFRDRGAHSKAVRRRVRIPSAG